MTMADVHRLMKYWSKYPPIRDLVAAFVGFEIPKDEADEPAKYMTAEDLKRLMSMTGGRIPGVS